jgi:hypothetical protein
MAHFAKIGLNNVVTDIVVVDNIHLMDHQGNEIEERGRQFLKNLTGHETWVQGSYNTYAGQHAFGKTPFRKNYPQIGGTYDAERDAFIPPEPENTEIASFTFNEETCRYERIRPEQPVNEEGKVWVYDDRSNTWVDGIEISTVHSGNINEYYKAHNIVIVTGS